MSSLVLPDVRSTGSDAPFLRQDHGSYLLVFELFVASPLSTKFGDTDVLRDRDIWAGLDPVLSIDIDT